MVVETENKPDCFSHLPDKCRWFDAFLENGEQYGCFALHKDEGSVGVHLEISKWSIAVMKELKRERFAIIREAKRMGVNYIYAVNKNYKDKLWGRFIRHFGFPKPDIIALSSQEI